MVGVQCRRPWRRARSVGEIKSNEITRARVYILLRTPYVYDDNNNNNNNNALCIAPRRSDKRYVVLTVRVGRGN